MPHETLLSLLYEIQTQKDEHGIIKRKKILKKEEK